MIDAHHHAVRLECGMSLDLPVFLKLAAAVYIAEHCLTYATTNVSTAQCFAGSWIAWMMEAAKWHMFGRFS